jgi:hypothetical protein
MESESWEILLLRAHRERSETLFEQALSLAEKNHGPSSSEAGLCLMDFADFLEESGQLEEAEAVIHRYRSILRTFALKLWFGKLSSSTTRTSIE